MRNFPSDIVPSGWYMIGWSWDFPVGEPKALSYFGEELVAYRGASGDLHVLSAYCRHMGAHLGHGGCVEGDSIRCPYHGWLWDRDGRNVEIPYSSPDKMGRLTLGAWPTREIDGTCLVYYSADGSAPLYELPDTWVRFDGETWAPCEATTKTWLDQAISPQYLAENAADAAHFKYVHLANEIPPIGDFAIEDGVFKSRIDLRFGGHTASTWATPTGPVDGHIFNESWGLGVGWARLTAFDDVIYLGCITPTSTRTAEMRATTWVAKKRGDGSEMSEETRDRWVAQQNGQVDSDMIIWNNMSYIEHVPWAQSEADPMRMLRSWSSQFYIDGRAEPVTESRAR
jgi:nitrite reductase/ring-hydroxylating ferredoxin subunit